MSLYSIFQQAVRTIRVAQKIEPYVKFSYSQFGEDMILDCFFAEKKNGFYVDVGAHHPQKFSNTCLFYNRGWSGINIDATPGSMEPFRQLRPRDINLEGAVSEKSQTLHLNVFNEPAFNGFSRTSFDERAISTEFQKVAVRSVSAKPLRDILDEHLPAGHSIDFLNVDVEGMDTEVLRSNDWIKYRPSVVLAEETTCFVMNESLIKSDLVQLMRGYGYKPCSKSVHSIVFIDTQKVNGIELLRRFDVTDEE